MKKGKKIKLFLTSLLLFFVTTPFVFAEDKEWSLEIDWPAAPNSGKALSTESGIAELVAYFYEWGILIGILIFFGILIYAGFKYLTSTGNPSKLTDAKKRLVSGLSGVILLLGSYLILNAINPELTNIQKIDPDIIKSGSHEFSSGMQNDQNLCEFSLTTIQESEGKDKEVYFLIPGLARKTSEVLPIKSKACTAEREDSKIREVRKLIVEETESGEEEEKNYLILVNKQDGEEIEDDDYERVEKDTNNDDYNDKRYNLYAKRYEKVEKPLDLNTDKEIFKTLEDSRYKNNYNLFYPEECEEKVIGNPDFNRPRCLELEEDGTLTEWKKIGYASLVKALNAVKGGEGGDFSSPQLEECPSADDMNAELGYKRDRTGGGCNIAFYDGEETNWWGKNRITCSEQISKPSADMNTFDGLVDRETNCMELNRYENPLDIDYENLRYVIDPVVDGHTIKGKMIIENENFKEVINNEDDLEKNSGSIEVPKGTYKVSWQAHQQAGTYDAKWENPKCDETKGVNYNNPAECEIEINKNEEIKINIEYKGEGGGPGIM